MLDCNHNRTVYRTTIGHEGENRTMRSDRGEHPTLVLHCTPSHVKYGGGTLFLLLSFASSFGHCLSTRPLTRLSLPLIHPFHPSTHRSINRHLWIFGLYFSLSRSHLSHSTAAAAAAVPWLCLEGKLLVGGIVQVEFGNKTRALPPNLK